MRISVKYEGGDMAHPAWFDPAFYAGQKVEQMTDIKYLGRDDWTTESYTAELENFRDANGQPVSGETADDKAYTNFLACNSSGYDATVPRSAINVSPNQYFDVGVYVQNLADYSNTHNVPGAPAGGWTLESMLQHLYTQLHISAWEHYTTVGMFADINPSNSFNTRAYMDARVAAMNSFENSNGSVGWGGKDDWTLAEAQNYLAQAELNPIMDFYGAGGSVFNLTPTAAATQTEIPDDWNQWQTPPAPNPYDDVKATVEMTVAQTAYAGDTGVNTRFEAIWNNATEESTIAATDMIRGGSGAYNTLAVELDAPWPGFRGQNGPNVTNIGCIELTHGDASPATPYTFDARNIQGAERFDINASGTAPVSLKNLAASVTQVNIHDLLPLNAAGTGDAAAGRAIETTSIEFAAGAVSGSSDSLSLGLENTGTEAAPAPIYIAGIENLTVNALSGASVVNLQNVSGVRTLKVEGGGNVKITNVANGIETYDASASTGIVNMAASDLKPGTTVIGGMGMDTLTLTQNFNGAPASWSGIDSLAINPGVQAAIQGANIRGLSSLWANTGQNVSLTNLPATPVFTIYENFSNSSGGITVTGGVQNLNVSTAGYAAAAGGGTQAKVVSDVANNVVINSTGEGNMGGTLTFAKAAGSVELGVAQDAAFSGSIAAVNAHDFKANISGTLANGAKFNVVDASGLNGSVTIAAAEGITGAGQNPKITLDSDGASKVDITSGGEFTLASGSSLNSARDISITLDGADASFDSSQVKMPQASNVTINGGDVVLGNLGGSTLSSAMRLVVNDAESFGMGKLETGSGNNIIANISAEEDVRISDIAAGGSGAASRGDAHLTVEADSISGASTVAITGADVFVNLSGITGDAFSSSAQAALTAAESINFTGAAGADHIRVNHVGMRGPSHIDLGSGADELYIAASAVTAGQNVRVEVELGPDTDADLLTVNSQASGARLGIYVNDFTEGVDELAGFRASSSLTTAQAQTLLASFGVADIPVTGSMITSFGSGRGVLYDGDLYGFNASSNATTMVVLAGVSGGVGNLAGAPDPEPVEPDAEAAFA